MLYGIQEWDVNLLVYHAQKRDFFMFELLLGHLVGDFFLQNDWMALNKHKRALPAIVHCLVYSVCVNIFMIRYIPNVWMWFLSVFIVFLTHIAFDATNFIEKYCKIIGGRTWAKTKEVNNEVYTMYTCIVKTAVDNTFHLVLMWIWFSII